MKISDCRKLLYTMYITGKKILSKIIRKQKEYKKERDFLLEKLIDFPHVQNNVKSLWGTKECREYIYGILIDSRGNRKGFPLRTTSALMQLLILHDSEYSCFVSNDTTDNFRKE